MIDPIDGTNNFIAGLGAFGVCIGLMEDGVPGLGVVYDVTRDVVYSAAKGEGAWLGNKRLAALETPDGKLIPIVPDVRGRAFMVDPRLRGIDMQLLVRRYEGAPLIQVIRVFALKSDGIYELDYWCDICAIPMFILKDCECCQGPTRLRERLTDAAEAQKPAPPPPSRKK